MALHWFGNRNSPSFCCPQGSLVFRIRQCHRLPGNGVVGWFMAATGARPKEIKINLMHCICLCREVEIICGSHCI